MVLATRRRKLFIIAGALCCSSLLLLVGLYHQTPDHWLFSRLPDTTRANSTSTSSQDGLIEDVPPVSAASTFCEGNSCLEGSWIAREEPYTKIEDLAPWTGCPSTPPSTGQRTEEEQASADAKRLLDVMNWTWRPSGGILKEWDPAAFVVRLLQSPAGLVIVGDDMSDQYFSSVVILLRRAGIIMDLKEPEYPYIHSYVLSGGDVAQELVKRAGVPETRRERPVLTLIEDSFLVSLDDLKSIARRVGATADYRAWESPFPVADGWPDHVRALSSTSKEEEALYPEDTVLLMNTGLSWSRSFLTLLRPRNRPIDEQTRLTEAYRQMVRVMAAQLKLIPKLSIYYRATTPAHPNCGSRSIPYLNNKVAQISEKDVVGRLTKTVLSEAEREQKRKWDWDLFSIHNDVWRRATVRLEMEREASDSQMAKWEYIDVWNQTLQRPDAHYSPLDDCLNWCPPSIFDQWTHHIYHTLMMKAGKTILQSHELEQETTDGKELG